MCQQKKYVFAKVACTFCVYIFSSKFFWNRRCVQVSSPINLYFNFKLDKMFSWNPLPWFIFAIKKQINDGHKWNSTSLCKTDHCFFIQLKIYEPIFGFARNGKPFARENNSLVSSIWIFFFFCPFELRNGSRLHDFCVKNCTFCIRKFSIFLCHVSAQFRQIHIFGFYEELQLLWALIFHQSS